MERVIFNALEKCVMMQVCGVQRSARFTPFVQWTPTCALRRRQGSLAPDSNKAVFNFENQIHNEKKEEAKMKKQIETAVTARLLHGAFLLVILSLNHVSPSALGQGETSAKSLSRAGAQWAWQNPLPQGNSLFGLSFSDANNGTTVGLHGTILRTADGGRH